MKCAEIQTNFRNEKYKKKLKYILLSEIWQWVSLSQKMHGSDILTK